MVKKGINSKNPVPVEIEDDDRPLAIRHLYPSNDEFDSDHLTMVTETPPNMIMPLVRQRLVIAALDPNRKESLLQIFTKEYDLRMISKGRAGRQEFIDVMREDRRGDEEGLNI